MSTELLDGLHASPDHALRLHKDVRARHSIGMHFATFSGSEAESMEPVAELYTAQQKEGVPDFEEEGGFGVMDVGATVVVSLQPQ